MPATNPSIRVVKTLPFKGGVRQWSNRYHFNGSPPPDDAHWHTLFDAVVAAERLIHDVNTVIVEALGYVNPSDVAVSSKVYSTAGALTVGAGGFAYAGESCALARWSTAARSTKNHPIYAFSYWHGVTGDTSLPFDKVWTTQRTAMQTYATSWITGFSDGGSVTAKRATPAGHLATGSIVDEYVTHRDFPYTPSV